MGGRAGDLDHDDDDDDGDACVVDDGVDVDVGVARRAILRRSLGDDDDNDDEDEDDEDAMEEGEVVRWWTIDVPCRRRCCRSELCPSNKSMLRERLRGRIYPRCSGMGGASEFRFRSVPSCAWFTRRAAALRVAPSALCLVAFTPTPPTPPTPMNSFGGRGDTSVGGEAGSRLDGRGGESSTSCCSRCSEAIARARLIKRCALSCSSDCAHGGGDLQRPVSCRSATSTPPP